MRDLTTELTVFLISVDDGTENRAHCVDALGKQTVKFRFEEIHNVAPMDRAFQEMLDRCQTPFFVQVDHDMILHEDGIEKLYDGIRAQPEDVAFFCLCLWDVHLDRNIIGCKIYRHAPCKPVGFQSRYACEMDFNARLEASGFRWVAHWPGFKEKQHAGVIGLHGAHYTEATIYERYKRLIVKARKTGKAEWVWTLPKEFLSRYDASKSRLAFFALAGAIVGMAVPLDNEQEQTFNDPIMQAEVGRIGTCLP